MIVQGVQINGNKIENCQGVTIYTIIIIYKYINVQKKYTVKENHIHRGLYFCVLVVHLVQIALR